MLGELYLLAFVYIFHKFRKSHLNSALWNWDIHLRNTTSFFGLWIGLFAIRNLAQFLL